jgi:hypothetical protein
LERLEQQNHALSEEVRQLRQDLAAARGTPPPAAPSPEDHLKDQVAIDEARTAELDQTKVGASQRFPIRITGMALFNTFLNSQGSGGQQYPTFAWLGSEPSGGGTLRQTTIGLDYSGPQSFLGGSVHGSVYMDFWGGTGSSVDQYFRLRTGSIGIDWSDRGILAGVESPIFAPREPASLAQVAFAPLSGAGNLWFWIPQVRFADAASKLRPASIPAFPMSPAFPCSLTYSLSTGLRVPGRSWNSAVHSSMDKTSGPWEACSWDSHI